MTNVKRVLDVYRGQNICVLLFLYENVRFQGSNSEKSRVNRPLRHNEYEVCLAYK